MYDTFPWKTVALAVVIAFVLGLCLTGAPAPEDSADVEAMRAVQDSLALVSEVSAERKAGEQWLSLVAGIGYIVVISSPSLALVVMILVEFALDGAARRRGQVAERRDRLS